MCLVGIERRSPGSIPAVQAQLPVTSSSTWRKWNRSPSFGSSAPGRRPASQSTWNPLQMPSTGPPAAANRATDSIAGAKRAIAPARR